MVQINCFACEDSHPIIHIIVFQIPRLVIHHPHPLPIVVLIQPLEIALKPSETLWIPLVNSHTTMENPPFFMGKSAINDYKWQFSIAMLVIPRGYPVFAIDKVSFPINGMVDVSIVMSTLCQSLPQGISESKHLSSHCFPSTSLLSTLLRSGEASRGDAGQTPWGTPGKNMWCPGVELAFSWWVYSSNFTRTYGIYIYILW